MRTPVPVHPDPAPAGAVAGAAPCDTVAPAAVLTVYACLGALPGRPVPVEQVGRLGRTMLTQLAEPFTSTRTELR